MSTDKPMNIEVKIERRSDGGIRVFSDNLPGLILSHKNGKDVLSDMPLVVQQLLPEQVGASLIINLDYDPSSLSKLENQILDELVESSKVQEYAKLCA
jgi:hypothetical protein